LNLIYCLFRGLFFIIYLLVTVIPFWCMYILLIFGGYKKLKDAVSIWLWQRDKEDI
jgi:hypothetical protein